MIGLVVNDVELVKGPHLSIRGKGRKQRCVPLNRHSVAVLRQWLKEHGGGPDVVLFGTIRGHPLSHDALAKLVAKHAATAATSCSTISAKHVTPHVLRHSSAMELLAAGVDTSVIALWLGHEHIQTTQIYLHGDLTIKEQALARTAPRGTRPGRYRPPDPLLKFLEGL